MARYAKSAFWFRGKVGRFAGATFYRSKGLTIQREIVPVSNPQTTAQMRRRVRWGILVLAYQYLQPVMRKAFENLRVNISEFNEFMKRNIDDADNYAFMRKTDITNRWLLLAPWHITNGSLPEISTGWTGSASSDTFQANDLVVPVEGDPEEATIGEISQAIVSNNLGWRYGDLLSFVFLMLRTSSGPGLPALRTFQIKLDANDETSLDSHIPTGFKCVLNAGSQLALQSTSYAGLPKAAVFVHSRQQKGRTKVSSATLTCNAKAMELLDSYQTESALQAAIDSYGLADDAFYDGQALPD